MIKKIWIIGLLFSSFDMVFGAAYSSGDRVYQSLFDVPQTEENDSWQEAMKLVHMKMEANGSSVFPGNAEDYFDSITAEERKIKKALALQEKRDQDRQAQLLMTQQTQAAKKSPPSKSSQKKNKNGSNGKKSAAQKQAAVKDPDDDVFRDFQALAIQEKRDFQKKAVAAKLKEEQALFYRFMTVGKRCCVQLGQGAMTKIPEKDQIAVSSFLINEDLRACGRDLDLSCVKKAQEKKSKSCCTWEKG